MKQIAFFMMVIILVITFSVKQTSAEVKLPSIFCDNMLMQQQTQAAIWGYANKKFIS